MSKFIRNASLITIATALIAVAGASTARADDAIAVKVPFKFMVGHTQLPAGSYVVSRSSDDPAVETIRSADGRRLLYRLTVPWDPETTPEHSKLIFVKLGHEYFLTRIAPEGGEGREIPITAARMEHDMISVEDGTR